MKFLVTATYAPGQAPLDGIADATEQVKQWVSQHRGSKLETAYTFIDGGGIGVVDADSEEDLQEFLAENPATAYFKFEAQPLIEFDRGVDRLKNTARPGPRSR